MPEEKKLKHIAFIMDGNRRFANGNGFSQMSGHKKGAEKLSDIITWCHEFKIPELTVYAFSHENFNRPEDEKKYLFDMFISQFDKLKNDSRISEYGLNVKVIGDISLFSKTIQKNCNEIEELTKNNSGMKLNIALGYGGRQEIVGAVKKIAEKVKSSEIDIADIDEELIKTNLYISSEPDLVVRTSGEKRLSGFLLWQSSYSEILFIEKMWPEITRDDFEMIVSDFLGRERRFGK